MRGKFITFEGPDGSGKSTNIKHLETILKQQGFEVIVTREPGGTPLAEQIRGMLLSERMVPKCEMLMFAAARAQHVEELIKPAIERGAVVICDRFADSTYAYQGTGRGFVSEVEELERFVLRGFEPDYTLFFDVTLEESLKRLSARFGEINNFDAETRDFKLGIYRGYKKRFLSNPQRMVRIDAMGTIGQVQDQVVSWAELKLIPELRGEQNFVMPELKVSSA